jgi:hypothetical protein
VVKFPYLYGGKAQSNIYMDQRLFEQIEERRGDKSRNKFMNELLEKGLKQ